MGKPSCISSITLLPIAATTSSSSDSKSTTAAAAAAPTVAATTATTAASTAQQQLPAAVAAAVAAITENIEDTEALLSTVIDWSELLKSTPPAKLLIRPPVRFLYDLFALVAATTGFGVEALRGRGWETLESKQDKLALMDAVISGVTTALQLPAPPAKASDIIVGRATAETNRLLQLLAVAAAATRDGTLPTSTTTTAATAAGVSITTAQVSSPGARAAVVVPPLKLQQHSSNSSSSSSSTSAAVQYEVAVADNASMSSSACNAVVLVGAGKGGRHSLRNKLPVGRFLRIRCTSGAAAAQTVAVSFETQKSDAPQTAAATSSSTAAATATAAASNAVGSAHAAVAGLLSAMTVSVQALQVQAVELAALQTASERRSSMVIASQCEHTAALLVVGLEKRLKDAESARDRLEREKTVLIDRATRAEEEALDAQVHYLLCCAAKHDELLSLCSTVTAERTTSSSDYRMDHIVYAVDSAIAVAKFAGCSVARCIVSYGVCKNTPVAFVCQCWHLRALTARSYCALLHAEVGRERVERANLCEHLAAIEAAAEDSKEQLATLTAASALADAERDDLLQQVAVVTEERDVARSHEEELYSQVSDKTADLEALQESYVLLTDRWNLLQDESAETQDQLERYQALLKASIAAADAAAAAAATGSNSTTNSSASHSSGEPEAVPAVKRSSKIHSSDSSSEHAVKRGSTDTASTVLRSESSIAQRAPPPKPQQHQQQQQQQQQAPQKPATVPAAAVPPAAAAADNDYNDDAFDEDDFEEDEDPANGASQTTTAKVTTAVKQPASDGRKEYTGAASSSYTAAAADDYADNDTDDDYVRVAAVAPDSGASEVYRPPSSRSGTREGSAGRPKSAARRGRNSSLNGV
eukprot:15403-Heterococcus_DN1.PRE.1